MHVAAKHSIATLFAAAAIFATRAHAADCQLQRIASLTMDFGRDGELLVPTTIGTTPLRMAIATGSSIGDISTKTVDDLHLGIHDIPQSTPMYESNGQRPRYVTVLKSLKLGMQEVTNTIFIVSPASDYDPDSAGLIGYDVLKHFDLDFDFGGNTLNLFSKEHCAGKVVYWTQQPSVDAPIHITKMGTIGVTMTLDGHDVDTAIETDSPTTEMTLTESRAIFGIDEKSPGVETVMLHGQTAYRTHFKTLTLSGVTVVNPLIYLVPDAMGDMARRDMDATKLQDYQGNAPISSPHLSVGLNVLRKLHLYISYDEDKIYATAADAR